MTGNDLSGTEEKAGRTKGRRCVICTECGLCPGVSPANRMKGIRVLTKDGFSRSAISLKNDQNLRVIVADVGTTTIAMELCAEDGSTRDSYVKINPQVEFGRDVLSRIEAARDPQILDKMQDMVKSALAEGAERFLKCLKPEEKPFMVVAANTTMSYLLMGWDPRELGQAPFLARHLDGASFELPVGEKIISCHLLPGFSAFVGSDLYAGALACGMATSKELSLLVDLGTNGEILLGNHDGILATATAAGPAFEGGANRGVFGADLVKYLATLRREGLLDDTGLLAEPYFTRGVRIGNLVLTQETVRNLQVAKAAIMAGIQVLLRRAGKGMEEVDRVILAGGFGYFLNPEDASEIGLLPAGLKEKAISGGNTALAGAKRSAERLLQVEEGLEGAKATYKDFPDVKVINLAMEDDFQDLYMNSMEIKPMD